MGIRLLHHSHWNISWSFFHSPAAITHSLTPHASVYVLFAHGCSAQDLSQRPLQLRQPKPQPHTVHQLVRNEQMPYEVIQTHEGRALQQFMWGSCVLQELELLRQLWGRGEQSTARAVAHQSKTDVDGKNHILPKWLWKCPQLLPVLYSFFSLLILPGIFLFFNQAKVEGVV